MTTDTPISDAEVFNIGANSSTYKVIPYQVAQELERKLRDTQAKLDAITVGFFPTQDQLREWEQIWQAQKERVCKAESDTPSGIAKCKYCGSENYQIQQLYVGHRQNLYIVECSDCKYEVIPVNVDCFIPEDAFYETCRLDWNKANEVMLTSSDNREAEIESLRARNDQLVYEADNERILRYAAEAERDAETERCAKIAREYGLSPVVGRNSRGSATTESPNGIGTPVEPEEVYSPHTEVR